MNPFSKLFGKKKDHVIVPPGHKVVVAHPSPKAYFFQCESGLWIADSGNGAEADAVISQVEQKIAELQKTSIIWIIQLPLLQSVVAFEPFLMRLRSLTEQSRGTVGHCVVVPYAQSQHLSQIKQLQTTGIGVYSSADDGACFVEVHKPDGIVIGMPGKPFVG